MSTSFLKSTRNVRTPQYGGIWSQKLWPCGIVSFDGGVGCVRRGVGPDWRILSNCAFGQCAVARNCSHITWLRASAHHDQLATTTVALCQLHATKHFSTQHHRYSQISYALLFTFIIFGGIWSVDLVIPLAWTMPLTSSFCDQVNQQN